MHSGKAQGVGSMAYKDFEWLAVRQGNKYRSSHCNSDITDSDKEKIIALQTYWRVCRASSNPLTPADSPMHRETNQAITDQYNPRKYLKKISELRDQTFADILCRLVAVEPLEYYYYCVESNFHSIVDASD